MSIRFKLTIVAVAVIVVANSLLSLVALNYLGSVWLGEVQTRVERNLNAARAAYRGQTDVLAAFLEGAARDRRLAAADAPGAPENLAEGLRQLRAAGKMDFAVLLNPRGEVVCRAGSDRRGDDLSADPLVARALRRKQTVTGTVILSRQRLLAEGNALAERACFEIVPTEGARPTDDRVRADGMVVVAAVPVLDDRGQPQGFLYGGNLINRRYELVDAIKRQIFPEEVYHGRDLGTVTIFQGDMRISTNVTMDDGTRAVGTRLSESVCKAVLDPEGVGTWAKEAWVVNDWYITAYERIRDPQERIIGVLYVGLLKAPFVHRWNVVRGVFLGIVLVTTASSLVLLFVAIELVLRPIRSVVTMAQKVIGGDLSARVGMRPPGDMGVLCRAIDSMAQAVAEREELLQRQTRQQIGRSEQLASVGRLAAGVAHEINNPLTGVLALADLMQGKENLDPQDREDLEVIVRETKRAREIVRGLLEYARETPSVNTRFDLNELIRQTTRLLGKRDAFQKIVIVEDLADDLPAVYGDKNRLQQVLVNLALNACEAMPSGGTLLIGTACEGGRIVTQVTDTGTGIKREHLEKVFEPFFTTKPVGKGTGLGLSVSCGIVQQHGGTLSVESHEGRGATFRMELPIPGAAEGPGGAAP